MKEQHGVRYYQVTGELSGIGHSQVGFEYVYGPIDAKGVDQSQTCWRQPSRGRGSRTRT